MGSVETRNAGTSAYVRGKLENRSGVGRDDEHIK